MDLAALKEIANGDQLRHLSLIGFDPMGSACRFPQFNLKRGIADLLLEVWKKLRGGDKHRAGVTGRFSRRTIKGLVFEAVAIRESDGVKVGLHMS